MAAVNDTAWQHWYFETFSEAGDMFIVSFARDPSYKLFGQGVTRLELRFAWANGTSYSSVESVDETMVQDCCGEVLGSWTATDKTFSFRISQDLKIATIRMDSPRARGTVQLKSLGPARYPSGETWPSRSASTQVSPYLHFAESIVAANAEVDLKIGSSRLEFSGWGGHNHLWAAFDWFTIVHGWRLARGVAGPFAFSLFNPISKVDHGVEYQSAILLKDGEPIFTASGPLQKSFMTGANHVSIEQIYGGAVHSKYLEQSSAWTINFFSPESGESWSFVLEHNNLAMDLELGSASSAAYFVDKVTGGEANMEQYKGYALSEQAFFPEKLGLNFMYQVWSYFLLETRASVPGSLWWTMKAIFNEAISTVAWKLVERAHSLT